MPTPPVSRRTLLRWIVLRRTVGWTALLGSLLRRPLPDGMESRILRSAARVLGERAESQLAALSSEPASTRIPSTAAGGQSEPCRIGRRRTLQTRSRREPSDLRRRRIPRRLPFRVHPERDSLGTWPDRRQPRRPNPCGLERGGEGQCWWWWWGRRRRGTWRTALTPPGTGARASAFARTLKAHPVGGGTRTRTNFRSADFGFMCRRCANRESS
jgi:hypothetical protein